MKDTNLVIAFSIDHILSFGGETKVFYLFFNTKMDCVSSHVS